MGTFVFKWEHPASEVYVTGTFDDWKKSEQLNKVGEHFEKDVTLSDASKKIFYKFVVDGNWVTDHTAPKETDESGNENNVLVPERIKTFTSPDTTHTMSTVTPESTTAALAGAVPLEKNKSTDSADLPGTFPETPAFEVGVNPLPATAGAVNPITLAPGEKIPEHLRAQSTTDNVRLDPESYEKADTLPGGVSAFTSSAAPTSTTAELAGQVPLEAKVPEVVKESQEKANADPEASAIPAEVADKAEVESELLTKVKEAPSTSEGTAGKGTEKTESTVTAGQAAASVAAAAGAIGAAAVAAVVAAKDTVVENAGPAAATAQATATEQAAKLPESVKQQLPVSVQQQIGGVTKEETIQEVSPQVPAEVKESIVEAGRSPEAAANTEAVVEKKAMEQELLKEVKPAEVSAGESSTPAAEKTATPVVSEPVKPVETTAVTSTSAPTTSAPTTSAPTTSATAVDATTLEGTATATTAEEAKAVAAKADPNGTTTTAAETPSTDPTTPAKPVAAPVSTSSTPAESTTDKKKKSRLSAFISKLKSKAK